jgi:hypothetical protein
MSTSVIAGFDVTCTALKFVPGVHAADFQQGRQHGNSRRSLCRNQNEGVITPTASTLHVAASHQGVVSRRFGQRRNGLIAGRPDSEAAAMKLQPKHGPDARADPARRIQAKEAPGTVDDPAAVRLVKRRA